jgi:hypothetical protein
MHEPFLDLYKKGFLPGPYETLEKFLKRVAKTREIALNPLNTLPKKWFKKALFIPVDRGYILLKNKNYRFFEAARTTIIEVEKDLYIPVIHAPSKISSFFVSPKEVMAHEEIHARRVQFDEPKYEEILAYRSSSSILRKWVSPCLSTNKEISAFFLALFLTPWSLIPLFCLFFASLTFTAIKQFRVYKCVRTLKELSDFPEEILLSMTDEEITLMSKGRVDKIHWSQFKWEFIQECFGNIA